MRDKVVIKIVIKWLYKYHLSFDKYTPNTGKYFH